MRTWRYEWRYEHDPTTRTWELWAQDDDGVHRRYAHSVYDHRNPPPWQFIIDALNAAEQRKDDVVRGRILREAMEGATRA